MPFDSQRLASLRYQQQSELNLSLTYCCVLLIEFITVPQKIYQDMTVKSVKWSHSIVHLRWSHYTECDTPSFHHKGCCPSGWIFDFVFKMSYASVEENVVYSYVWSMKMLHTMSTSEMLSMLSTCTLMPTGMAAAETRVTPDAYVNTKSRSKKTHTQIIIFSWSHVQNIL